MEIDPSAKVCPICGYEFPRQSPVIQWIALILVVLLLLPTVSLAQVHYHKDGRPWKQRARSAMPT